MKLSIKAKLIFVIGFMSLLLIAIGALGLTSLASTNNTLKNVYENKVKTLKTLERMVAIINENQILVSEAFAGQLADFPEPIENVEQSVVLIKSNIGEINNIFSAYRSRSQSENEQALLDAFDVQRKRYGTEGLMPAVAALVAEDFQQVGELLQGPLKETYPAVRNAAELLISYQLESAADLYQSSQAQYGVVRNISIVVIVAGVAFGSFLGVLLIRGISRPLSDAVSVAQCVAEGDLTTQITVLGKDETGQLMSAMQRMTSSLSGIVSSVRAGTDAMIESSRNIAQGNSDLASRTDQQAASLQEAASSMEELTTTVKTNANHAQHANELVSASADIARKGGAAVKEVVDTMASIKSSSSQIEEIVSVIDGISFQTNLLALNAAVEAARAGEQGRGFAVVAGEVRSLAQRSADAAKQIKQLIEDSVSKVDAGSVLVESAGATMSEIVESVTEVTDIMSEIASASQQQSAGIELVTTSVGQMDQMTQENAAMVQQAMQAAESLKEQARELERAVSVFQLGDSLPLAGSFRTAQPSPDSVRPRGVANELSGLAMG